MVEVTEKHISVADVFIWVWNGDSVVVVHVLGAFAASSWNVSRMQTGNEHNLCPFPHQKNKKTNKNAASPREPEPDPHLRSLTHSSQVSLTSNCSYICSLSWPLSLFLLLHLIPLFTLLPQPGSFPLLVRCYLAWLVKLGKDSIPPRDCLLFLHHWHVASSSPGDQEWFGYKNKPLMYEEEKIRADKNWAETPPLSTKWGWKPDGSESWIKSRLDVQVVLEPQCITKAQAAITSVQVGKSLLLGLFYIEPI